VTRPYVLALLAEAYGKARQPEEGLAGLAEALVLVDKTGERFYEAEVYRLKGELVLQSGVRSHKSQEENQKAKMTNPQSLTPSPQHLTPSTRVEAEAEACFHKAIEIARRQQAKSLELRAVMSLSRLWQQQGKKTEARKMLAEISPRDLTQQTCKRPRRCSTVEGLVSSVQCQKEFKVGRCQALALKG
jgi:hypothetical protein